MRIKRRRDIPNEDKETAHAQSKEHKFRSSIVILSRACSNPRDFPYWAVVEEAKHKFGGEEDIDRYCSYKAILISGHVGLSWGNSTYPVETRYQQALCGLPEIGHVNRCLMPNIMEHVPVRDHCRSVQPMRLSLLLLPG